MTSAWSWLACMAFALGGCFDSLISDSCTAGFIYSKGACVAHGSPDGGAGDAGHDGTPPDAGVIADGPLADAPDDAAPALDAPVADAPDAQVCPALQLACSGSCVDGMSDPDNCGGCGNVCASGVCSAGLCQGNLRGHIVAIGHDFRSYHPAMARVLGNAVALGGRFLVTVARWNGTATPAAQAGTTEAITDAMRQIGRPWRTVALPGTPGLAAFTGIDVLVVDAQTGDGSAVQQLAVTWRVAITSFVARGGVVIVLEGGDGVSYQFAAGAGLYAVAAPVDVTGQLALCSDGTDVTTQQVVSPYLAEATSVTMPGAPAAAITTITGGVIVFHITR